MKALALALAGLVSIAGAAVAQSAPERKPDLSLEDMLSGNSQTPEQRARGIEAAEKHPLGSENNPIRVEMPPGEHAYLRRLRCADGRTPAYNRLGSMEGKAYPNIVDAYEVTCASGKTTVYMDMYHHGHVENRPVPGFTIQ